PLLTIVESRETAEATRLFRSYPCWEHSLIEWTALALLYAVVRNQRPSHVVEIGTFKGWTAQVLARALHANGRRMLHTVGPFDPAHFLPLFQEWPPELRQRVRFYPVNSMDFFMQAERDGTQFDLVFVDGNHDYEFALFDIQCAARRMVPGGFIAIDNVSQSGPYCAAIDFLAQNPEWRNCGTPLRSGTVLKAFERGRGNMPGMDFIFLRAP